MTEELKRYTVDVTSALAFGEDPNTLEQECGVIQEHLAPSPARRDEPRERAVPVLALRAAASRPQARPRDARRAPLYPRDDRAGARARARRRPAPSRATCSKRCSSRALRPIRPSPTSRSSPTSSRCSWPARTRPPTRSAGRCCTSRQTPHYSSGCAITRFRGARDVAGVSGLRRAEASGLVRGRMQRSEPPAARRGDTDVRAARRTCLGNVAVPAGMRMFF